MKTGLSKKFGIKILRKKIKLFTLIKYRESKSVYLTRNQRQGDFCVSLTSYPKRFDTLPVTLRSLFAQTVVPRRIKLYLAADEIENAPVPDAILRMQSDLFCIAVVEENYRPYNKLIHALREMPDQRIITVDDDRQYPSDLFEALDAASLNTPNAIICSMGRKIGLDATGQLLPYAAWSLKTASAASSILPLGCGGVLYPPNSLHKDVDRPDLFMDLAPTTDDLWFKMMSFINGTPVISLRRPREHFPEIILNPSTSLWSYNMLGADDENTAKLLRHYKVTPRAFTNEVHSM
jgi:hypothetical protein